MRTLFLSLTLAVTLAPQEPTFHSSSSELVVLPVIVTARHGSYVSDLPRERFAVFDNGRRVAIELFSNEDTPVTIALVIDASGSMGPKIGEVLAGAAAFAGLSQPNDELFAIEFNDDVHDLLPERRFLMASDQQAIAGDRKSTRLNSSHRT